MSDGKIYIVITDKRPTGGPGQGEQKSSDEDKKGGEGLFAKYAFHRFANFLEGQAKQAVSYSINNIGNFTGNYIAQREIQSSLKAVSTVGNIGMAMISGAKYGPVGVVVAASIAIASEVINNVYEQHSLGIQQKKDAHEIELLKQRSGLNSLTDGSRGTEN